MTVTVNAWQDADTILRAVDIAWGHEEPLEVVPAWHVEVTISAHRIIAQRVAELGGVVRWAGNEAHMTPIGEAA